ncbi:DUF6538 domain-containing protein [Gallaecimonas sp. GXIMD4217]|uniref:DUF6538 domain-containing protein n=1 Tax=Gallaecimonas sp. GXIMD4217 TaxID=3131927 RepID=UPI00311ABD57
MASSRFIIRNRHGNSWHGRIIIPSSLRTYFDGRKEIRRSLRTADRTVAVRRALALWLHFQKIFESLRQGDNKMAGKKFGHDSCNPETLNKKAPITLEDALGAPHHFDLGDPDKELEAAQRAQARAEALLERYKDNPEMLDRLFRVDRKIPKEEDAPQTPTPFNVTIDLYYKKLETQGRKGKRLAPRTLLDYKDKLTFWQDYFGDRMAHSITQKELSDIQGWLTRLPSNYAKKGLTAMQAADYAKAERSTLKSISDNTRAQYLGQLKGAFEYAWSCGFTVTNMAGFIELPNTQTRRDIERLPFTIEDLRLIFPGGDYGTDFGDTRGKISLEAKFWFPLLGAFTGARLEELAQLKVSDIRTCPDTGIIYAMVDNRGTASDGVRKRTKNLNSVRQIPIHPMLIKIGLLKFLEERKQDGPDASLFRLARDKQGRMAKGVSNWFSRFEPRQGRKPRAVSCSLHHQHKH